jgi:hypothetical protein
MQHGSIIQRIVSCKVMLIYMRRVHLLLSHVQPSAQLGTASNQYNGQSVSSACMLREQSRTYLLCSMPRCVFTLA